MIRTRSLLIIIGIGIAISTAGGCQYLKNQFKDSPAPSGLNRIDFNERDMYTLKITQKADIYDENGNIMEAPFVNFQQVVNNENSSDHIIEEVYLYLGNYNKANVGNDELTTSGPALYFLTYPIVQDAAEVLFNNKKYISTYSVRKVLVGKWTQTNIDLEIELADKKKSIIISGFIESGNVVIQKVNHPKPDIHTVFKNESLPVDIESVFNIDDARGLVFLENTYNREFIYPDWSDFGWKLNKAELKENHNKVVNREHIGAVYLKYDAASNSYDYPVTFLIQRKDSSPNQTDRYITYKN